MPHRFVATYEGGGSSDLKAHDRETLRALSAWIAEILGAEFVGEARFGDPPRERLVVPVETLVGDERRQLGVEDERGIFGGCVEHAHAATKAISHPLWNAAAEAPEGWPHEMTHAVRDVVLPGFTAFNAEDALAAGRSLLGDGDVRLKFVRARGGGGQVEIASLEALETALREAGATTVGDGVVLERNLVDVETLSVGEARLDGRVLSYTGTQTTTSNARGESVFGGSHLRMVRGPLSRFAGADLSERERTAVAKARAFDAQAMRLPGFCASRRNYDVAFGTDASGAEVSGVLEQSWRIGGASGAELAAFEAFRRMPDARYVHACTCERYGDHTPPPDARLIYRGVDQQVGRLVKYARVEAFG